MVSPETSMLSSTVLCFNPVEVELAEGGVALRENNLLVRQGNRQGIFDFMYPADWDPEEDFDLGIFDDHSLDMEEDGGARVDG